MSFFIRPFFPRLLLKQLVTMEVILWTSLWNTYEKEFVNENSMLGGPLGPKAAEDLRQRIIEHVRSGLDLGFMHCCFAVVQSIIHLQCTCSFSEYSCCFKVLLENYLDKTCRAIVSQYPGLSTNKVFSYVKLHPWKNFLTRVCGWVGRWIQGRNWYFINFSWNGAVSLPIIVSFLHIACKTVVTSVINFIALPIKSSWQSLFLEVQNLINEAISQNSNEKHNLWSFLLWWFPHFYKHLIKMGHSSDCLYL